MSSKKITVTIYFSTVVLFAWLVFSVSPKWFFITIPLDIIYNYLKNKNS